MPEPHPEPRTEKPKYTWPYFVLAAVILGIVLAVFWVSREVARTRQIQRIPTTETQPR